MFKNILILIFFSFGILNCGYTPIITKIDNNNFNITKLDIEGDKQINNFIKRELNKYIKNTGTDNRFEVDIITNFEKISLVKNTKGDTTDFKLVANLTLIFFEENENEKKIIELNESFAIKKNENNYEQNNYERAIKNNIAQALSKKIIFYLSKN